MRRRWKSETTPDRLARLAAFATMRWRVNTSSGMAISAGTLVAHERRAAPRCHQGGRHPDQALPADRVEPGQHGGAGRLALALEQRRQLGQGVVAVEVGTVV